MRILIAVKGAESESYFRSLAAVVDLDQVELIVVAHVVDVDTRKELYFPRHHLPGKRPLSPERFADIASAEEEAALNALRHARLVLEQLGAGPPVIREVLRHGKPQEELLKLAGEERCTLVVVGRRTAARGPQSIGKTARFVIDHAAHAVLVLR